ECQARCRRSGRGLRLHSTRSQGAGGVGPCGGSWQKEALHPGSVEVGDLLQVEAGGEGVARAGDQDRPPIRGPDAIDMAWMTSDPSAFLPGPFSTSWYTSVGMRRF